MNGANPISVVCISQDSFYRDLNPEDLALAKKSEYNFDHPRTIDDDAIYTLLEDLSNGTQGRVPIYDFKVIKSHFIDKFYNTQKLHRVTILAF